MSQAAGRQDLAVLDAAGLEDACVVRVVAEEALSTPFRVRVELIAPADAPALGDPEATLLGAPATLRLLAEGVPVRRFTGYVASFDLPRDEREGDGSGAALALDLAPRLAALRLRRQNRVFQEQRTEEIVEAVLADWQIPTRWELKHRLPIRAYAVQYDETDYDFVTRLLSEEGLSFFDDATAPEGDDPPPLVLTDGTSRPRVFGDPRLVYRPHRLGRRGDAEVERLSAARRVRPSAVRLSDFDYRRPQLVPASRASERGASAFERKEPLEVVHHRDRVDPIEGAARPKVDDAAARLLLEQHRADAERWSGEATCRRLAPGHVFGLDVRPEDDARRGLVVTAARHHLEIPERTSSRGEVDLRDYCCEFECAPADAPVRPPPPPRSIRQVMETATVVGPEGHAVWTDAHGRIKVQFHWDRRGSRDDKSSCWLRVAQPWVGASFGLQALPRVGTEVLVSFLGGDPDRPIVVGGLHNGLNPHPFPLPGSATKSGLRTRNVGSEGFHELSFEDAAGHERVKLRAQRELDVEVVGHHVTRVGRDDTAAIAGSASTTVGGDDTAIVGGSRRLTVKRDHHAVVGGDCVESIGGGSDRRVSGDARVRIEGDEHRDVAGTARVAVKGDAVSRVDGHATTIVGKHDARRSAMLHVEGESLMYSSDETEIVSPKAVTIRCGESAIHLTPRSIDLCAPTITLRGDTVDLAADTKLRASSKSEMVQHADTVRVLADKTVALKAEGATLRLAREACLDGDLVKLNCGPAPVTDDPTEETSPPEPTRFTLLGEDHKPLARQRFVLLLADGTQRTGVLGDDGSAELVLDASGKILFPDVDDPRKG